ncbi:50S ribosomal protein L18 [Bradymonas sediminis]|uniref:Large ribosomal subunit protein uL18 n=1 Tax=Bradymonas sediminis TaxID=1548548 RepID=A0A2Z4FGX9_9DELT|nr:50S ribosomal protein L18 [Bradymonas sediminis]AWV87998.1 50S ribosomal protein L18 [Bradymonas sediminis]TDP77121.1 LSU ribosomal protein L18P [Bradymonas sediminis]
MLKKNVIKNRRQRRKRTIRNNILGTPSRPRLTVFRSSKHIYAQVIDDLSGHTLVSASSVEKGLLSGEEMKKIEQARHIGKVLAQRVQEKGIDKIVFDRNGFIYHGRIAAVAEGAREGGLKF